MNSDTLPCLAVRPCGRKVRTDWPAPIRDVLELALRAHTRRLPGAVPRPANVPLAGRTARATCNVVPHVAIWRRTLSVEVALRAVGRVGPGLTRWILGAYDFGSVVPVDQQHWGGPRPVLVDFRRQTRVLDPAALERGGLRHANQVDSCALTCTAASSPCLRWVRLAALTDCRRARDAGPGVAPRSKVRLP